MVLTLVGPFHEAAELYEGLSDDLVWFTPLRFYTSLVSSLLTLVKSLLAVKHLQIHAFKIQPLLPSPLLGELTENEKIPVTSIPKS